MLPLLKELLSLQLLFSQYVKELSLPKEIVDVRIANPRPQDKTCITSGFQIQKAAFKELMWRRTDSNR